MRLDTIDSRFNPTLSVLQRGHILEKVKGNTLRSVACWATAIASSSHNPNAARLAASLFLSDGNTTRSSNVVCVWVLIVTGHESIVRRIFSAASVDILCEILFISNSNVMTTFGSSFVIFDLWCNLGLWLYRW